MPSAGFEAAIPATNRMRTYGARRLVTSHDEGVIGGCSGVAPVVLMHFKTTPWRLYKGKLRESTLATNLF
jgi:hypothetical protein